MSTSTLPPGATIGPFPYVIESRIGAEQGAMSEIYTASIGSKSTGNSVVIKIAKSLAESGGFYEESLRNEVTHLRTLNHPGIVHIYPIIGKGLRSLPYSARTSLPNEPWFSVMEYLPHGSLHDLFAEYKNGLPLELALETARYLACTLDYIHGREVVHMDIKPQNIMFRHSIKKGHVIEPVLVDFGISRSTGQGGLEAGTLEYSSPERVEITHATTRAPERTLARPDPSMDIYSLGIILYEMVTGQKPYETRSRTSIISDILAGQPTAPSQHYSNQQGREAIAAELDELILRMLSKKPDDRPQAQELANSLEQTVFRLGLAHRNFQSAPATNRIEPIQPAKRSTSWRIALPLILTALLIGGVLGYWLNSILGEPVNEPTAVATGTPVSVAAISTTSTDQVTVSPSPVDTISTQIETATAITDATLAMGDSTPLPSDFQQDEPTLLGEISTAAALTQTGELTTTIELNNTVILTEVPPTVVQEFPTQVPPTQVPPTPIPPTPRPTIPATLSVSLNKPVAGAEGEPGLIKFSWSFNRIPYPDEQFKITFCKKNDSESKSGLCTAPGELDANGLDLRGATAQDFVSPNTMEIPLNAMEILKGINSQLYKTSDTFYWGIRLVSPRQSGEKVISEAREIILN